MWKSPKFFTLHVKGRKTGFCFGESTIHFETRMARLLNYLNDQVHQLTHNTSKLQFPHVFVLKTMVR